MWIRTTVAAVRGERTTTALQRHIERTGIIFGKSVVGAHISPHISCSRWDMFDHIIIFGKLEASFDKCIK